MVLTTLVLPESPFKLPEEIVDLYMRSFYMKLTWQWVKGPDGVLKNKRVDELGKESIKGLLHYTICSTQLSKSG